MKLWPNTGPLVIGQRPNICFIGQTWAEDGLNISFMGRWTKDLPKTSQNLLYWLQPSNISSRNWPKMDLTPPNPPRLQLSATALSVLSLSLHWVILLIWQVQGPKTFRGVSRTNYHRGLANWFVSWSWTFDHPTVNCQRCNAQNQRCRTAADRRVNVLLGEMKSQWPLWLGHQRWRNKKYQKWM